MTKIIGLTGGIGSGKSTVARMFNALGVPIYISDDEAKKLMESSKSIQHDLLALFGPSTYLNGRLNRPFISSKVFKDKALLSKLNAIVHPKVAAHFKAWLSNQNSIYIIKEVAILFETNSQDNYDCIITVVAPLEKRLQRVVKRGDKSEESVRMIVSNQLPDAEKTERSDFVISNNSISKTKSIVASLHKEILYKINNPL